MQPRFHLLLNNLPSPTRLGRHLTLAHALYSHAWPYRPFRVVTGMTVCRLITVSSGISFRIVVFIGSV
jgi:hypothetical protein